MPRFRWIRLSLKGKFLLGIILVVVPVLGILFTWMGVRNERHAVAQVLNQARILARQIILTRQWIADVGGVMVDRNSMGAQGALYFYDEQLVASHTTFQRYTPAMVTKRLSNYSMRENLYQFRLASMNPMNPRNHPDSFEQMALYRFIHNKEKEIYYFGEHGQKTGFRYSVPLYVDDACLKCHTNFSKGTVGGCLSIIFPENGFLKNLQRSRLQMVGAGIALIMLTIGTLFFTLRQVVIKPIKQLEKATGEISNGNLDARLHLETGDEFQLLSETFNTMGTRLLHSREIMEEKIRLATCELSEANTELQKLDRLKTEFIADMSHELRSPVTAIKGGLDYLKRKIKDEDNKNYLALIDNNLLRLTHLVSDMLELTRIEAGKIVWNFEENDLAVLVREVEEILSLKAKESGISLGYAGTEPVWVEMDLERIEQVLVNLIENAIKFSSQGTRIEIDIRVEGAMARVTVADEGIGIAEEHLETIFEKFHTLPSSGGQGRTKGTGLGLTICRKIISAHGGQIWAQSTLGEGSVFTFTLPLKQNV